MPLLPDVKWKDIEHGLIAECLRKAADLIDTHDNGDTFYVDCRVTPYVTKEEMGDRWLWAMLALLDHFDIQTSDLRRLANVIGREDQDSLWTREQVRAIGGIGKRPDPSDGHSREWS